jgi:hypothetical protein
VIAIRIICANNIDGGAKVGKTVDEWRYSWLGLEKPRAPQQQAYLHKETTSANEE